MKCQSDAQFKNEAILVPRNYYLDRQQYGQVALVFNSESVIRPKFHSQIIPTLIQHANIACCPDQL